MLKNIPAELSVLVGRSEELASLADLLSRHRLVTLTGWGGVGKSRLALRHATGAAAKGLSTAWVPLWTIRNGRRLTDLVADAVGFANHAARPPLAALCDRLAHASLLLVLDSCEHLLLECRQLAAQLLTRCPGVSVLVTSREPLGLLGEELVRLSSLPYDGAALDLFSQRAAAAGRPLTGPREKDAAVALCRRLEGIPLALELAASQLPHAPVTELAGRALLTLPSPGTEARLPSASPDMGPPRHVGLHTAIGWSHELCTPQERLVWARASVLRGPIEVTAARAVCSGGPLNGDDVSVALAGLARKSVLLAEPDGRYRMLDTIREYGGMWLAELGMKGELRARHAAYFADFARRAHERWPGGAQSEAYRAVERAYPDLCAALDHLLDHDPQAALGMAGRLALFWNCTGHLHETRSYLERALELSEKQGPEDALALWALGFAHTLQEDHTTGLLLAQESLEAAQVHGDTAGKLRAAYLKGLTHLLRGRPLAAWAAAEDGLADEPDETEDPGTREAGTLCRLLAIFAMTGVGDLRAARTDAEELRDWCLGAGEHWTRSYCEYQLAVIALFEDRPADGVAHARHMLRAKASIGDRYGIALGLDMLAAATAELGDTALSARASGAGSRFWESVGHPQKGTPEVWSLRERTEQSARTALGDTLYDEIRDSVSSRTPEALLEEFLKGPSQQGG
ncbi:ATP-binding protein [Streptomyces sp. NPDC004111]|uniref:ATP-binding protein n=1 Tax=Streptomyces sp. NPDC004111 TaxID=3364690 RepID=UPI00368D8CD7